METIGGHAGAREATASSVVKSTFASWSAHRPARSRSRPSRIAIVEGLGALTVFDARNVDDLRRCAALQKVEQEVREQKGREVVDREGPLDSVLVTSVSGLAEPAL